MYIIHHKLILVAVNMDLVCKKNTVIPFAYMGEEKSFWNSSVNQSR